jgi:alpha-tubulin suppressor-like RCC1 family protein
MGSGPYPDVCAGPVDCSKNPVAVIGGHTFKPGNTLDGNQACAIATDDITYCWGASPNAVSGAPTFTSIAAGDLDYCGIVQNGDVYCWGTNRNGRFGQPPDQTQIHSVPELQASGHAFVRISMAQEHMCGLVNDGNAWCWGKNDHGQLGDRTTTPSSIPVRVRLYAP